MTGGLLSTTVTVWLQVLVLLQASMAAQVRVAEKALPQPALVTVLREMTRLVPQASAGAVGWSKVQDVPRTIVLLVAQLIVGAVLSTVAMVWLHLLVLP